MLGLFIYSVLIQENIGLVYARIAASGGASGRCIWRRYCCYTGLYSVVKYCCGFKPAFFGLCIHLFSVCNWVFNYIFWCRTHVSLFAEETNSYCCGVAVSFCRPLRYQVLHCCFPNICVRKVGGRVLPNTTQPDDESPAFVDKLAALGGWLPQHISPLLLSVCCFGPSRSRWG